MDKLKIRCSKLCCIIFVISALFSVSLIFNNNLWFDESYTLSLIQHNYSGIIEILESDMHPPLYFLSLKVFCEIFGYSIPVTKVFSVLGYIATLSLGLTVIKKHFDAERAIVYMLAVGAIPMSLYFSVQQRSYQWCIFFITLCFIEALLFLENGKARHGAIFVIAALFAAYNHIYALLAVGIIFAFVNIYALLKNRNLLKAIIISDVAMIAGYSPWMIPLLHQTKAASGNFWLTGVEPLSVIVFVSGMMISALILTKKENRRTPMVFAIICILSIQAIGLFVTIFIRPFYIARYSVVILGIFALMIAFSTKKLKLSLKKAICIVLCVLNIACVIGTGIFEYDSSLNDFFIRFDKIISPTDTFVYCDSSFGILSYYYPESTHICTYNVPWFAAFDHVECIDKNNLTDALGFEGAVWFVKNKSTKIPEYIKDDFDIELVETFKCDFNFFEVYSVQKKKI